MKDVASRDGIEIIASNPSFPVALWGAVTIDGTSASSVELAGYFSLFVKEWLLYPRDMVRRAGIRRIVFCTHLTLSGRPRSGIPDWVHDTLYLDVGAGFNDPMYLQRVLHHEVFHMIDYRDDGQVYEDSKWSKINASAFKYSGGAERQQNDETASSLSDAFPGFINRYSMTGVEEDKAVIFSTLMVNPGYIEERAQTDVLIRAKVALLKELLLTWCPDMDESFWRQVSLARQTKLW